FKRWIGSGSSSNCSSLAGFAASTATRYGCLRIFKLRCVSARPRAAARSARTRVEATPRCARRCSGGQQFPSVSELQRDYVGPVERNPPGVERANMQVGLCESSTKALLDAAEA